MLHQFGNLIVSCDRPLSELPLAPPGAERDVTVTSVDTAPPRIVRWFQTWNAGGDAVRFGRVDAGYLVDFDGVAAVVIAPDAADVVLHPAHGASEADVRHLLLHQVLPLVVSRRGRCVLHASAVSWRDRVVAFTGRTGSGKSTFAAACAANGAALVGDDSLILDRLSGVWRGVPSYPGLRLLPGSVSLIGRDGLAPSGAEDTGQKVLFSRGSTWPSFETRTLPLARIFVLSRGTPVLAPAAKGSAAAVALASQLFRLDVEDGDESRRLFDDVTSLVRGVPISILHVQDDVEDLRALARRLLNDA